MARDSGGTYSLPAGYPLAYNLRPVPSSLLNSGYSDMAAEITDSLSRSGKGGMLANLAMGGFSITAAANGTFSGTVTAATLAGAGSGITALNASQLTSGTIPDARFPATLPAASGVNLTNLNGSAIATGTVALTRLPSIPTTQITGLAAIATSASASDLLAGTIPAARFPATLPAADGSALTNLNGSAIASGTVAVARLGTGTPTGSNFLRGDGTWQTISGTVPGGGTTGQFLRGDSTWSSTIVGTLTATTFSGAHSGDGSALTSLNASQLSSGTVPAARLNGGSSAQFVRGDGTFTNALLGDLLVGSANTGASGLALAVGTNLSFAEGSGTSFANVFRQTSSAATIVASGYKWSATANGFASSVSTSFAKSAIGLGVAAGGITFYTDAAAAVTNGTDATPTTRMTISSAGNVTINAPSGGGITLSLNTGAGGNAQQWGDGTRFAMLNFTTNAVQFGATTNHNLDLSTNNIVRATLDTNGNLLVGTSISDGSRVFSYADIASAFTGFSVVNGSLNSAATAGIKLETQGGTWRIQNLRSGAPLSIGLNGTERARFEGNGFGITEGNSPTQALNLYRSGSTVAYMAAGNSNTGLDGTWFGVDTAGNAVINQRAALAMIFSTSATERMRLDTSGNLLLGATANPGVLNTSVVVDSGANSLGGVVIQNNSTGRTFSDGGHLYMSGTEMRLYNAENNVLLFGTNNTERMRISSAGNLTINAPSSGVSLSVNGSGEIISATGTNTYLSLNTGGNGSTTGSNFALQSQSNSSGFRIYDLINAASRLQIGTAGNVTINAPSSGDHTVQHSVGGSQAIGYRGIPRSTTASTIALADRGQCVAVTAGITIPNATFAAGDAVSIYNDSASAVTITQGASLTLRQAGTTNTGNRTLAARGMATVWFNSASEAVISGSGLT